MIKSWSMHIDELRSYQTFNPNYPLNNAMIKTLSLPFAFLFIFICQISNANDSSCNQFYNELSKLPHTRLTETTNGFVSILDGKSLKGCEVIFESNESRVSGEIVYQKFQSFTNWQGWYINENLCADGAGSSTVVIENNQNRCILNWSQPSWIDEKSNEYRQSENINLVVQCMSN
jgi:hypothetical protein